MSSPAITIGSRVRVLPTKPNGEPHPQAGRIGTVTEVLGVFVRIGIPRAMICLEDGPEKGNYACVSLICLEVI